MLSQKKLEQHLNTMQWAFTTHDDKTVKVLRQSTEGEISIFVRLNDNWLICSVVPFLATGGDNSFELSRWLLRVNRDSFQTKFAYDEDGDVVLTVELPTQSIDASEITLALESLVKITVEQRRTLRVAAS